MGAIRLTIFILVCISCNQDRSLETQFAKIAQIEQKRLCQLDSIKTAITLIWDNVNDSLRAEFEGKIPQAELKNMLAVRNSSMIRMFQSYETLDAGKKQLVDDAQKKDELLAKKLLSINKELKTIADKKRNLLASLDDQEAINQIIKTYEFPLKQPCKNIEE